MSEQIDGLLSLLNAPLDHCDRVEIVVLELQTRLKMFLVIVEMAAYGLDVLRYTIVCIALYGAVTEKIFAHS